jgi:Ni/Co efflux regulator RcnB
MPRHRIALAAALALVLAGPALAKKPAREAEPPSGERTAALVFDELERQLIRDYFADPSRAAHAEGKPLPPGIAKKVARGGSLPPGIAKRYLPDDLDRRLRPRPAGYERLVVGGDVLLVEVATGVIHDIVRNALRGR